MAAPGLRDVLHRQDVEEASLTAGRRFGPIPALPGVAGGEWVSDEVTAAPHWREVAERSGQPIDERLMLDVTDPHWSTWPACVAVEAAGLQGRAVGDRFLRRLRRAALTERRGWSGSRRGASRSCSPSTGRSPPGSSP